MVTLTAAGANSSGAQAVAGGAVSAATVTGTASPSQAPAQAPPPATRTEKQKELARQTERLFDMATELKVQVDKTNKNILSMKVVEQAQEIELLAKGLKDQAKR